VSKQEAKLTRQPQETELQYEAIHSLSDSKVSERSAANLRRSEPEMPLTYLYLACRVLDKLKFLAKTTFGCSSFFSSEMGETAQVSFALKNIERIFVDLGKVSPKRKNLQNLAEH
jgi:hypothetical protein